MCEVFTKALLGDVISCSLIYVAHLVARLCCCNTSLVGFQNDVVDLLLSLAYFANEYGSGDVGSITLPHSADVQDNGVAVLTLAVVGDVVRICAALTVCSDRVEGHAAKTNFLAQFCSLLVQLDFGETLCNPWNQFIHNLIDLQSGFLHDLVLIFTLNLSNFINYACVVYEGAACTQFLKSQNESCRPGLVDTHCLLFVDETGQNFYAVLHVIVIGNLHAKVFHLWEQLVQYEVNGTVNIDVQRTHSFAENKCLVQQVVQSVLVGNEHLRDVFFLHLGNGSLQTIFFQHDVILHFLSLSGLFRK